MTKVINIGISNHIYIYIDTFLHLCSFTIDKKIIFYQYAIAISNVHKSDYYC